MYTIEKDILYGGIVPRGVPTIGHYLGTIRNWVNLQDKYTCSFTIADLYASSKMEYSSGLAEKSSDLLTLIIATGLEGEKNNLYIQSNVPEHAELMWLIFAFITRHDLFVEVDRIRQDTNEQTRNTDLLVVADFLLYRARCIPVGYNYIRIIELTKFISTKFNELYGNIFIVPAEYIDDTNSKVLSLQNSSKPMSRQLVDNPNNNIYITDEPKVVSEKINSAIVEIDKPFVFDNSNPYINNLLNIYKGITKKETNEVENDFKNESDKFFRECIASSINNDFKLLKLRYNILSKNQEYLRTVIKTNASVSSYTARKTVNDVKGALGLFI